MLIQLPNMLQATHISHSLKDRTEIIFYTDCFAHDHLLLNDHNLQP
jgi:hypothetical protein